MNFTKTLFFLSFFLLIAASSCSSDDESTGGQNLCMADDLQLTQTDIVLSTATSTALVTFDVENTSSSDYNINTGSPVINGTISVTTTDGSVYESTAVLGVTTLSAGATSSIIITGSYGAGKTYESNTVSLFCN